MPIHAAVGSDGFSIRFYLSAWILLKRIWWTWLNNFFVDSKMHRSISASLICLIPKVDYHSSCPVTMSATGWSAGSKPTHTNQ